eukprot:2854681-Amphidinium_carterae.1
MLLRPETDLPIKTPTGLSVKLKNGHFCINSGDKWIKKTVASVQIERRGCWWAPVKYYQNVHIEIAESQMSTCLSEPIGFPESHHNTKLCTAWNSTKVCLNHDCSRNETLNCVLPLRT